MINVVPNAAVTAACFLLVIRADAAYGRMETGEKEFGRSLNYIERLFCADYASLDTAGPLKVVPIEPGLKLLSLTGESFCLYAVRSEK